MLSNLQDYKCATCKMEMCVTQSDLYKTSCEVCCLNLTSNYSPGLSRLRRSIVLLALSLKGIHPRHFVLQAVESRNEETTSRLIKKALGVAESDSAKKTLVSHS